MDIIAEVEKLNLPFGKYVVIGSAILQMKGIRDAGDIDLVITEDLLRDLRKRGWKRKWFFYGMLRRGKAIKNGSAEAYSSMNYKNYRGTAETLIQKAEIIDGIPFWPLEELAKFKKELGREKDFKDIALIENYLKKVE